MTHNIVSVSGVQPVDLIHYVLKYFSNGKKKKKERKRVRETTPMLFSERTGSLKEEVCDSLFFNEPTLSSE